MTNNLDEFMKKWGYREIKFLTEDKECLFVNLENLTIEKYIEAKDYMFSAPIKVGEVMDIMSLFGNPLIRWERNGKQANVQP